MGSLAEREYSVASSDRRRLTRGALVVAVGSPLEAPTADVLDKYKEQRTWTNHGLRPLPGIINQLPGGSDPHDSRQQPVSLGIEIMICEGPPRRKPGVPTGSDSYQV